MKKVRRNRGSEFFALLSYLIPKQSVKVGLTIRSCAGRFWGGHSNTESVYRVNLGGLLRLTKQIQSEPFAFFSVEKRSRCPRDRLIRFGPFLISDVQQKTQCHWLNILNCILTLSRVIENPRKLFSSNNIHWTLREMKNYYNLVYCFHSGLAKTARKVSAPLPRIVESCYKIRR